MTTKQLHSQEGKNEEKQKEEEKETDNWFEGVEESRGKVPQACPITSHLEESEKSQWPEYSQPHVGTVKKLHVKLLEQTGKDHREVKRVKLRFEVLFDAQPVHPYCHFYDKYKGKNKFNVFHIVVHLLWHIIPLERHTDCVHRN